MNSLTKFTYSSLFLSALILNTACSALDEESTNSGLTNTTTTDLDISTIQKATITTDNAPSLSVAGISGIRQAVDSRDSSPFIGASAKVANDSPVQTLTVAAAQQIAQDPAAAEIPNVCDTGSIDLNIQEKLLTVTNCVTDGLTLNGTAIIATSQTGDVIITTYDFNDFTVDDGSGPQPLNLIAICENNTSTRTIDCSYRTEAVGADGRTYIAAVSSISGDDTAGYLVTATVNDPDFGNINITTIAAVTFNCTNDYPDSGSIKIEGESNEMVLTFVDCDNYSITFNSSTITGAWK